MGTAQKEIQITIKDLLESGAHFGHQRNRWNPKMKCYIYKELNGIYIIDLSKTIQQIRNAVSIIEDVVASHKSILFVGTKKQAKEVIKDCSEDCGEFYVGERWLGGMLTNLSTIRRSVKKLETIEKKIASGGEGLTKKELSQLTKEHEKLNKNLCGVRTMRKIPGLVVVVVPSKEHIAVAEAKKLGVPVMALVDTNCDPDPIDHIIACNDDALKSIKLILQTLTNAVKEKKKELNLALVREEKEEAPQARSKSAPQGKRKPRVRKEAAEETQEEAKA